MKIFITGTDTNVGKTLLCSWLCLHAQMDYWKPIQTGSHDGTDAHFVHQLTGTRIHPEAYLLREPLSPHAAAAIEQVQIEPGLIQAPQVSRLIVEGAGGVLVPIVKDFFMMDLIHQLSLPVILVARSTLGTINHTCLTLEALRKRGVKILGVMLNGPLNAGNRKAIEDYGKVNVLMEFPQLKKITRDALASIPLTGELRLVLNAGA